MAHGAHGQGSLQPGEEHGPVVAWGGAGGGGGGLGVRGFWGFKGSGLGFRVYKVLGFRV